MSDDSSKPAHMWHSGGERGVIASVLAVALALFAPPLLVQPVAQAFMPLLPISTNLKVALFTTTLTVLMVGIIAAVLAVYGKKFKDIGLGKPTWLFAGKALLGLVVYIALSVCVQTIARQFFNLNIDEPQELGYQTLTSFEQVVAFMSLVLVTPFAEELLFRGFLFTGVRRRVPFWVAAIGVSTLFAWIHGQWNVGLDVFVMSMVGCYLVEKTKSLWPAIFLHMFKNGVAFYLVYLYNGS